MSAYNLSREGNGYMHTEIFIKDICVLTPMTISGISTLPGFTASTVINGETESYHSIRHNSSISIIPYRTGSHLPGGMSGDPPLGDDPDAGGRYMCAWMRRQLRSVLS